ncbi:MAG: EamA family transporter [Clostridiales bacterium]|nr:EamA family transporter [Clostridiales bacterium]
MGVFGTVPLFIRLLPLESVEIAFWRAVLAAGFLILYFLITKKSLNLKHYKKQSGLLLLSGALMGINWVTLFEAYKHTTVSVATLIYYTAPLLVTAASVLILKEKITRSQIISMGAAALGMILIINPTGALTSDQLIGMLFAFAAAVLYASVIMLNRFIKDIPSVSRTLLQFIAAILVLTPYVLRGGSLQAAQLDVIGILSLLILGAIHTGLIYCLYFGAIQRLQGREIAILSYIDPLVAVLLSALILREPFTILQMLGGAMILGFTFISERPGKHSKIPIVEKKAEGV